ncbi:unnamed protein product [Prunus armeniaca]|uniref:Uncharacterized protein n=1 Tax=Prunus armeniaca TaxID=36596 RepID=A0A6J5WB90_PRUAR|nr:unnamed protein product [Prunus armeniaca]
MVQDGKWYLVGKGGKSGRELTNTQARRTKRQYGKARREMENQTVQSSPQKSHQYTRCESQNRGRSTVGMLRPKFAPEFAPRSEKTELRPFLESRKAIEEMRHELSHKLGQGAQPSCPKMPKLGIGKTFLKRPPLIDGQKGSTEEHNKTTFPEYEERLARPNLRVTTPQKLQRASLAIEEEEADNMSKDDNDDWLNYELNREEFKVALGLRAKDEDSQALEESQRNHIPTRMFGTIEEVGESTIEKPAVAIEESAIQHELMKAEFEKEPSMN